MEARTSKVDLSFNGTEHVLLDLQPGDVILHKKGYAYKVLDPDLTGSENLESMVSYQALYGSQKKWVRPKHMFTKDRFQIVVRAEDL